MKYQYCSNIIFIMFRADIARFLQYFRNPSNSFINIFSILQDFNGIFLKYSFNITVLCGESSKFSIYSHFSPLYIGTTISYIYLFIKYYLYFYNGYTEKKYGRCSDTTTNNTQDTIRTTLIYLMQPYDTSNSYILFSTAVLSPE